MTGSRFAWLFVFFSLSMLLVANAQYGSYGNSTTSGTVSVSISNSELGFLIALALIVIGTAYYVIRYAYLSIRLIVIGIALILFGTLVWYYGAIQHNVNEVWLGIIAILIGVIIWALGDWKGGAFNERIAALLGINRLSADKVARTGTEPDSQYVRRKMKK